MYSVYIYTCSPFMYSISNIRLFFRVAFWPVLKTGPSLGSADSAALPADTNMSS